MEAIRIFAHQFRSHHLTCHLLGCKPTLLSQGLLHDQFSSEYRYELCLVYLRRYVFDYSATDAVADESLYNAPTTGSCFMTCRVYRTTQVYTSKPSATVRTFLSGFRVTSFGTFVTSTWDTFGIQLDPTAAGTSSYTMSVTVFGQANLAYVSFFYLSYDTTALNVLYSKTAMNGRSYLGCYYTQNTCTPVFPATVNPTSNTTFKTGGTSVLGYTSGMFYMGLDSMIVTYSGNTVNRG